MAERAAREERQRIAEWLMGEAAHYLAIDGEVRELAAAALRAVAAGLLTGVPPTTPGTTPE